MKTKQYLMALSALAIIGFSACKKEKNEPTLNEKEALITAHTWKVQSLTMPKKGSNVSDSSIVKECTLLATLDFKADRNYTVTDPQKNCDSTLLPYGKGTWSYANNVLTLKGKQTLAWNISSLTESELKATYKDSIAPDKVYTKTITLKK